MATFANMTINDGTATPVARLFEARINGNGSALWVFDRNGIAVAAPSVTLKHTAPKSPDGLTKNDWQITIPVVDAPAPAAGYTPAPRVIALNTLKLLSITTGRGTTADRADLHAFGKNLMTQSQYTDSVLSNSPPRG